MTIDDPTGPPSLHIMETRIPWGRTIGSSAAACCRRTGCPQGKTLQERS